MLNHTCIMRARTHARAHRHMPTLTRAPTSTHAHDARACKHTRTHIPAHAHPRTLRPSKHFTSGPRVATSGHTRLQAATEFKWHIPTSTTSSGRGRFLIGVVGSYRHRITATGPQRDDAVVISGYGSRAGRHQPPAEYSLGIR